MKRIDIVVTFTTLAMLASLGAASAQKPPANADGNWSHMMMGPMAGCPMGAGARGMMAPHMMGPQAMGPGMMKQGMMAQGGAASINPQLEALRAALAIKPDQQAEWDVYIAAARVDAQSMSDMRTRMKGFMQGKSASAPDWLKVHRDMMRARATSLDTLAGAVDRLYGKLDTAQKATFDRYGGGMCGAWQS